MTDTKYTALRATVRYDGTNFCGWQLQPGERTIQGEIEAAMAKMVGKRVVIQCAGRTDSGVHALGQVFSFRWPGEPPARLRHALSQMLRTDIRIVEIARVPDDFNACFSALGKRYAYTFDFGHEADPFSARYAWHVPVTVDLEHVAALLPKLEGRHDFGAFESAGSQPKKTTVRNLHSVRLERGGIIGPRDGDSLWHLSFHGDGFLYRMVRNITGTLVAIGQGRFAPSVLDDCLSGQGRFRGHCAPAHGLVLEEVFYD